MTSCGYDNNNIENFLFFWSKLKEDDSKNEHEIIKRIQRKKMLDAGINFLIKRDRAYQIICLNDPDRDVRTFLQKNIIANEMSYKDRPYLRKITYVYSDGELNYTEKRERKKKLEEEGIKPIDPIT